jgi:hypothetical protein
MTDHDHNHHHDHDHHDHDHVAHEELHDTGGPREPDRRIHPDPADGAEANITRPAGPDFGAEDVAARGYDPEGPPSEPERSDTDASPADEPR